MKAHHKIATLTAMLALGVTPAFAYASAPPDVPPMPGNSGTAKPSDPGSQGTSHKPSAPGPNASLPAKAKAYGRYCKGESKKHVAGAHGTPFSLCVTAMAKLAKGQTKSPRTACKNESKRHVAGQRGTPFSLCVSGGAKLLKDQRS